MAISAQAVNSIHRATVMPSGPFFMARPSAIGSVICGRSAPETLRASVGGDELSEGLRRAETQRGWPGAANLPGDTP